jgi:peptidoglycan/xylan/chitin deacetylase (PgdA/CDA1 family)
MNRAIVLMYHSVAVPPSGKAHLGLYVTPAMFRFQMRYLKTAGFRVVSLGEVLSFIRGEGPEGRLVALTFDDGYKDFYENAYPVLRRHRYPSTVFLVSELIGGENSWEEDPRIGRRRLLDWESIREMKKDGVVFGSHSATHPFLSRLSSPDAMRNEIYGSKSGLEAALQLPVDYFCYPYGDYDPGTVGMVKEAGYTLAVTTKRGLVHKGSDPYEVRRSFIRSSTNPFLFFLRLHSAYEDRKRAG